VLLILTSIILLFALDRWSKRTAELRLRERSLAVGSLLRLRFVASLRDTYSRAGFRVALICLWVAALISAIALHSFGTWFQSNLAMIGLGVAIGGAAGNLVDILRWRYVVDFIDLRWWPVFNLADVAIVAGLLVALASQRVSS
jgi:signal peptidase II